MEDMKNYAYTLFRTIPKHHKGWVSLVLAYPSFF